MREGCSHIIVTRVTFLCPACKKAAAQNQIWEAGAMQFPRHKKAAEFHCSGHYWTLDASPVLWFPSSGTSSKLQFSQRRFLESRQSTELSYLIISYWLQLPAFTHLLVHCSPRPRAHTETGIQKEVAGTSSEAAKGVAKLLRAKH